MVLHSGVILLLLGQLFTSLFQVESQMRLDQGETKNYSLSYYHDELAVIDTSASDSDQVISIPDSQLYKGHKIGPAGGLSRDWYRRIFYQLCLLRPDQLPSSNYPHLQIGPMAVSVHNRTDLQRERTQHAGCCRIGLARRKTRRLLESRSRLSPSGKFSDRRKELSKSCCNPNASINLCDSARSV